MVRCGGDLHLSGYVCVAPEGALASVAAASVCVPSAKSPTSGKAMCSESDASVMRVDAVLGKVFTFSSPRVASSSLCCGLTNWASTAPLIPDRHLL